MVLDHEFPPDIRVENEIQSLHDAGNEIHLACFTKKGKPLEEQLNGVKVIRKPISEFVHKTSVGALRFPIYFNFWRKFLNELFTKTKYDAVHVHDLPCAQPAYEISKKYNAKLTLDLHENWPALLRVATHTESVLGKFLSKNYQWENYEKKYCNLADNVIVVVDEAKERLIGLGIQEEKIAVVSNTLNLNEFEVPETKPDPDFITLLYAGGINKHRGLQYVIKGIKNFKHDTLKLRVWILGTGSYVDYLKELAKSEGVDDNVFFEGWKNYKEMQTYFGKSDICLIPHVKNDHTDSTIPHKIFQYMYAGKPMLVSDCAPIERIVKETNSGLVYKFNDVKEFAEKLRDLSENDHFFNDKFVETNKKSVITNYNWEKESVKLKNIYLGNG